MSLLTRCPACETLFKLVPDQLRISQGWVKCGQCGEIFDASKHLIQVAVEPVAAPESPCIFAVPDDGTSTSSMPENDVSDAALMPAANCTASLVPTAVNTALPFGDVAIEVRPDMTDGALFDHETVAPTGAAVPEAQGATGAEIEPEPVAATEPETTSETLGSPTPAGLSQQTPTASEPYAVEDAEGQIVPVAIEQLTDAAPMLAQPLLPEAVPELPKVSFLGDSQRHSMWQSRGGRLVLWLAVFLLGASLWLQWLYWERDRLAATYPDQKPLLQQMCQALNCSIQTLQRIDAIAIDSAAFSRLGPDSYRLSFVIKNLSNLEVALPSVELTLTDTQEQVMVRRALPPPELFAVTAALLPGTELPVNLVLDLDLGDAAPRVIGYRLLAFYP